MNVPHRRRPSTLLVCVCVCVCVCVVARTRYDQSAYNRHTTGQVVRQTIRLLFVPTVNRIDACTRAENNATHTHIYIYIQL